ncbi:MAG: rod shape-determining protein MreC [Flavobacteriaceae bacterium]|nr:rod shape-determining protein MreC [Flavobacteriaceae bacterium]
MRQIIRFIEKYRYFLLFLFLEFFALFFTIQSHSYHRSKFVNSANRLTGGIYDKLNSINEFWNLKSENQHLLEENTRLKNILSIESINSINEIDSTTHYRDFYYSSAKIIKNDYTKRNNYLLINKGSKNGVTSEMAVVNSKGIVGVTKSVSNYKATVISILNEYSHVNAKPKNSNHFGTLSWDGKGYKTIQLEDLPRQAQLNIGDTIITGGKSIIFPEGILIGTIKGFEKTDNVYNSINITLFNDMSSLSNVNIITNLQRKEIQQLEKSNNE